MKDRLMSCSLYSNQLFCNSLALLGYWVIGHWFILWRITRRNHARGVPYMSMKDGIKMFKETRKYDKLLDSII